MEREIIRAALLTVSLASKAKPGATLIIPPALIDMAVEAIIAALDKAGVDR